MLRILSCLSVILFLSVASNAADDGGLFSFLNLESDARSLGLSGATVAMPMGGYGVVSNPAALAFCDTAEIIIGSRSMLLDMWVAPLGVVVPLHRDSVSIGTVAGSFVYQSHGTERAVDNRNEDLGYSWNVYAASGAVSYAAKVWRGCAVGLQLKTDYHYIYASPVDLISATAVALDVAAQYRVMHDRLIYGFTIKNLQIYLMPYSDLYAGHRMPLAFEAGVSFVPATLSQLRATLSVNKVEFEHAMYRIGAEYKVLGNIVVARAGYSLTHPDAEYILHYIKSETSGAYAWESWSALSLGVGINAAVRGFVPVTVDAGYQFKVDDLDPSLGISMRIKF